MALTLKIDPEEFILENVCSIKNYDCCNDNCGQCCNLETMKIYWMLWRVWSEVKHTRWVCREKHYKKDEVVDSRDDVIIMFKEIATKSFKMHVYNIKCQYSDLKHLKANSNHINVLIFWKIIDKTILAIFKSFKQPSDT